MVSARHSKQTVAQGTHGIVAFEYPDSATRLAATNFTQSDLYKIAIQLDDNSLWVLIDISPTTWSSVQSNISANNPGDMVYYDGTNWVVLPLGSDGYVLAANTALTKPNWVAPSGGTATASPNFGIGAGTQTITSGTLIINNSNGISFGINASTLTASYTVPSTAGLISGINVSGGTTSNNLSAITFSNSNGLAFGLNGSVITGSYTVPSTAGLISAINVSGGTTSNNLSALTFSNSNNITFGLAGSTITASASFPIQSNQTAGLYALGNTTQNSNTTLDVRSLSFNGLGDITVGYSNGSIQVSGSQTAQTQNVVVPSAGTQTATSGTIVFSNSNGISFGMSGSSRITASYTVPSTAGLISAINVSGGTTSNNLSALTFSNANGLSFGLDGSTITASYTVPNIPVQTNQTAGLYALGNTTQNSSTTLDARSLSFNGLGALTVGYSNGSIQLSAPIQTIQTSNIVVPSAGTQTATSGTVVFSNSNGISFGMSGSSRITASYTVPSTAGLISNINISAGTTSNNLSALTFSNANGITFGLDGSTITASYQPGAGASINFSAGTTSNNLTAVTFSNSNGFSFGLNGSVITGSYTTGNQTVQTQNIVVPSAGTQTATSGTVVFSDSNGISFGMSGSSRITASYTVPSTAGLISNINISAGTTSNNLSALTFSNSNGLAFGLNGSTITGSYTVPSTAGLISRINVSAGTTSNNLSAITFSNANGITFGLDGSTITASYQPGAGASINFSAGTTSNNLTAVTFSNSNGLEFGLNGSVITGSYTIPTQSNQTLGLFATGNTTQNSSTTLDARSLTFNALGGATFGYSNGSIQLSVPSTVGLISAINISAGTTSNNLTAVTFSNSNGLAFGLNGSTITGSYTVPSTAGLISRINISAGTTSNNLSALTFSNANGITFGLDASTITASYTVPIQSNQTAGLYALGNTTQNSSTTLDVRSLSFNGLGDITVGYSNGSIQVSGSQTVQTQSNVQGISAGTQVGRTGDIVFSNSNGISFGMSGSTRITASYTVPSTAGLISAINISAGTTSNNLSALTFSNVNGISFGLDASTITASYTVPNVPAQTNQTLGLYALSNTTGESSSSTIDARSLSFNGAGAISIGYSNSSLIISSPTQTVQTSNIVVPSAGTQTATSGTVVFSNSNGISFGMSGSSRITASYTVPSTAGLISNINISAGTTSNNLSALTFSNSNGLAFGLNGSTITGSYTVPSTAGLISNINISAGTTSNNLSALTFSNSNGLAFGLNGSTITGSYTVPTQTNQTLGLYGLGNTTGQSSSSTFDARTLSVSGAGIVSVGYSGNALIISAPAGGAQSAQTLGLYAVGNTTQNSSTTLDARTLSFNGLGNISVGYSNGSIQLSVPNNNISYLEYPQNPWQTNFTVSNASFSLQHLNIQNNMIASKANLLMALSGNTNSSGALTISLGIYTMAAGVLSLASSDSRVITWTSGSQTTASSIFGGISGTRYRTVSLNNWNISAGDYMLGMWFRTTNNGTWLAFGRQGPSIVGAVDANETSGFLNGYSSSSFTTAMIGSINVTNTNYVRTGGNALQQPSIIFMGSN